MIDFLAWAFANPERALTFSGLTLGCMYAIVKAISRKQVKNIIYDLLGLKNEVEEYVNNQHIIMKKLDYIAERQGIVWPADILDLWKNVSVTKKRQWLRWWRRDMSSARSAGKYTNSNGGKKKMREYLKKIGSRKFQAMITMLLVNVVSAILFATGTVGVDELINNWMPIINMTVATISTWVYILVEGGIDKERARKEVNADEPDYSQASDTSDKLTI